HLRLAGAAGDPAWARAVPVWSGLNSLDLVGNALPDEAVEALSGNPAFGGLTRLVLSFNGIGEAGMRLLCASPRFARVGALYCGGNPFPESLLQALEERFREGLALDYLREEDYLYTFRAEACEYWYAGQSRERTQVLLLPYEKGFEVFSFDFAGNF